MTRKIYAKNATYSSFLPKFRTFYTR